MRYMSTLSDKIRRAIKSHELSCYAIASKARVPQSTLTRFQQGNPMTTDSLDRLAPVLGVDLVVGQPRRRSRKGGSR